MPSQSDHEENSSKVAPKNASQATFLSRIFNRFLPPNAQDWSPEQHLQAKILLWIALVGAFFASFGAVVSVSLGMPPSNALPFLAMSLLLFLLAFGLKIGMSFYRLSALLCLILLSALVADSLQNDGLITPGSHAFFLFPAIGFLLGGVFSGLLFTGAAIFYVFFAWYLHFAQYFPKAKLIPLFYNLFGFTFALMLLFLCLLIWYYDHSRREALSLAANALEELEKARDDALLSSQSKSRFLASMSHELRTPLNAIIGYAELVEEELSDLEEDDLEEDVRNITIAGQHLLSLINGVLDLSKIEAGRLELCYENFSVKELFHELEAVILPLAEKNGNALVLEISEELGELHSDPLRIKQILMNLLSNACKFTKQGTVQFLAKRDEEGQLHLEVKDTGIGMTPEQLERAFTPFEQAEVFTSRLFGGTGLGLSICKELCEMMGGTIQVSSEKDRGTHFTLSLPCQSAIQEPPALDEISA